jgi:subfamily B ATP-binding cassette protein MsbA
LNDAARGGSASPPAVSMPASRVYRRLLRYAWPHRGMYLIGVIGMLLYAATDALTLYVMKNYLQDATALQHNAVWLKYLPVSILLIFFCRGSGDYLAQYFPAWVARQVVKAVRADLFIHYLNLPTARYDTDSSATMLSRLTYNTEMVAGATADSLTSIIRDGLQIAVNIGWLFFIDWRLAALGLMIAPAIGWAMGTINRRFRRYSARIQNSMGDVTRVAKEAFDAHRVIKVFNAQSHIARLFEDANEQNRRSNVRLLQSRSSSNPIVQQVAAFGLALVLFAANREIVSGVLTFATFGTFVIALIQVTQPLKRIMGIAGPLQQGIAAGSSVFEIIDAPSEPPGGAMKLSRARGDVEFRHVSFEYNAEKGQVLHDVNLTIPAGTSLAIVGHSGSGKSTLASLLPRYYDPTAGSVMIDGQDVRDYALTDLRRQMSLVSQEVVMFNDTIRNNILFGLQDVSDEQLSDTLRAAYVDEFVAQLPQGLDTIVGDRGMQLSGGQRQRIAIARALLRDTPILILDEATSALDTAAERHIQAALEQLVRNRTTLIIAHRLSTIEHADHILVMRQGSIIEHGAHASLLTRNGAYAELHRLNFSNP